MAPPTPELTVSVDVARTEENNFIVTFLSANDKRDLFGSSVIPRIRLGQLLLVSEVFT